MIPWTGAADGKLASESEEAASYQSKVVRESVRGSTEAESVCLRSACVFVLLSLLLAQLVGGVNCGKESAKACTTIVVLFCCPPLYCACPLAACPAHRCLTRVSRSPPSRLAFL